MNKQKYLRIAYLLLMPLDLLAVLPWLFALPITSFMSFIPLVLTIMLFTYHLKSFRYLGTLGYVPRKTLTSQMFAGAGLILSVIFIASALSSLSCISESADQCSSGGLGTPLLIGSLCVAVMAAVLLPAYRLLNSQNK